MIPRVLGYLCPGEIGLGPPAVEQNTLLERLTSGRNYDGVILAPSIRFRFRPMELERLQLKRIQSNDKLRLILEAESPFSLSRVVEIILQAGQQRCYRDHTPLARHFPSGRDRAISDSPGVIRANGRRKCLDSHGQGAVIRRARNEQFFARVRQDE